jgi:hypothetical protein
MTEICEGLRTLGGKLNHCELEKARAKSTACDGMRDRDRKFFEDVYLGRHTLIGISSRWDRSSNRFPFSDDPEAIRATK